MGRTFNFSSINLGFWGSLTAQEVLQGVTCVARGSEQAPDERAQWFLPILQPGCLARMDEPSSGCTLCVQTISSPSSSPPTPRAENLGKAFPQTSFNLGLHTFIIEINPWKSWEKEGSETQHPLKVFIYFLPTSKCIFLLLCPSCSSTVVLQPFSPCPDLGAGMLSAAPAFPLLVHPLPEVMEIPGAGAVLVEVWDGSWGHLLIPRLEFGTVWSLMAPSSQGCSLAGTGAGRSQVGSWFLLMAKHTGFAQHL